MDPKSLIGKTVILRDEIEECENYLEPGMRARIKDIRNSNDGVWVFTFDCSGFEAVNAPFETSNWYDDKGVARLTAREAGKYEPVDRYFLPGPEGWSQYFEVEAEDPVLARVLAAFEARPEQGQGYVAWLEAELVRAVRAGHDPLVGADGAEAPTPPG